MIIRGMSVADIIQMSGTSCDSDSLKCDLCDLEVDINDKSIGIINDVRIWVLCRVCSDGAGSYYQGIMQ